MKCTSSVFDFRFVGGLSVVLATIAPSGMNNSFNGQDSFVSAFCSKSNGINPRISRQNSYITASRDNSIDEWVSYLEEEFNRSGDDEGGDFDSNHYGKDVLQPVSSRRTYQTPVKSFTNVIDLLDEIDDAPPNELTVVLFFAHYCKTCHRTIVPFKQLANDSVPGVTFVRFETSALSPKQFSSLGIDRVPFLHLYRNWICVASFSATQKMSLTSTKIVLRPRLLENILICQNRSMLDWSSFRKTYNKEIEANKAARTKIREAVDSRNNNRSAVAVNHDNSIDEEEKLYRSVRTLVSESELLSFLCENKHFENQCNTSDDHKEENNFVVIMFHSHFDQSCLRAQQKFRKIASKRQQQYQIEDSCSRRSSFTMARVEASLLPDTTLQKLGIQRYPHIQIYGGSNRWSKMDANTLSKQCVASFSIPRSFLFDKMLHESLDAIDQRTPDEWTKFYNQHQDKIKSQQQALEGIIRKQE